MRDRPFPADLMRMWPISTRVNRPENDDASILDPIELKTDAAQAIPSLDIDSGDSERLARHQFTNPRCT
jgi:hypothetical protein